MKNPRGFVIIILVVVILAAAVHIDRFLHNTSVDGTSKSKEPDYISFDNGEKNTIDNKNPLIVIDDNDKEIEATSSSTGILFKNKKIRSYDGNKNRFFYGHPVISMFKNLQMIVKDGESLQLFLIQMKQLFVWQHYHFGVLSLYLIIKHHTITCKSCIHSCPTMIPKTPPYHLNILTTCSTSQ